MTTKSSTAGSASHTSIDPWTTTSSFSYSIDEGTSSAAPSFPTTSRRSGDRRDRAHHTQQVPPMGAILPQTQRVLRNKELKVITNDAIEATCSTVAIGINSHATTRRQEWAT